MKGARVIIVEDEPLVAVDLRNQLQKAGLEVMAIFESGEEIIAHLKIEEPDIILMDVRLFGDLDGVDTAHEINKRHDIPILFLTANTDHTTFNRAKLTFPHGFLSKPFRIRDVLHSIELALETSIEEKEIDSDSSEKYLADRVFIRKQEFLYKVMYQEILFMEADRAYCKIVTEKNDFTLSQTLGKIEQKIKVPYLLRVHRSFIINVQNVDKISEGYVHINTHRIPVSRAHRDELARVFNTI